MTTFKEIIDELENVADEVIKEVEAAGKEIVQELVPVIETSFVQAVKDFGQFALQTVANLMTDDGADMSGTEKANLAATKVVEFAESQGKSLLADDVTSLIKTSFTVLSSKLGAEPAAETKPE